jgi:hypothetical protein
MRSTSRFQSSAEGDLRSTRTNGGILVLASARLKGGDCEVSTKEPAKAWRSAQNIWYLDDGRLNGKGEECGDTKEGECHKIIPSEFLFEKEDCKYHENR